MTLPTLFLRSLGTTCLSLFFLFLPLLGGVVPARATEVPLGYLLRPGDNHRGIPLVRPALYNGIILAVDGPGFRIQDRSFPPIEAGNLTAWGQEPCYLEIQSCPADPTLEGERWEVDAEKSLAVPGFFALKSAAWNTRPDLPPGLAGASYSIRSHWTLENVFPPLAESDVLRSATPDQADRISIFDPSHPKRYRSFYAQALAPAGSWRWSSLDKDDRTSRVIPPGHGWLFYREPNRRLNLGLTGEARVCALRIPLRPGMNLVAPGLVRTTSFRQFAMGSANGFQSGSKAGLADRISLFRGQSVDTFALLPQGWISLRSLRGLDPEVAMGVRPDDAVQIFKQQADPDFAVPRQP